MIKCMKNDLRGKIFEENSLKSGFKKLNFKLHCVCSSRTTKQSSIKQQTLIGNWLGNKYKNIGAGKQKIHKSNTAISFSLITSSVADRSDSE